MDYARALQQYHTISVETGVTEASPHQLIGLLLQGALDHMTAAKGSILRGEVAAKGTAISEAISIIDGLRLVLDHERGGSIARNLEDLYDYMQRRLVEANLRNDPKLLDEALELLRQVKEAWDAIADVAK